ncbi:MAG: VOC family protein [Verrucomicrobia bacterium]|nr:VOC family protein [Verrucomicrobiota bacterium]
MKNQGIHLSWIVVKDFKAAIKFYTEIAGFTIKQESPEYGWAELSGPTGSLLGVAQESPHSEIKSGSNTITTISVDNIDEARSFFEKSGVKLIGNIQEVPGHVKMQTFADIDGNVMQLVQTL